jgi:hypothetical protein
VAGARALPGAALESPFLVERALEIDESARAELARPAKAFTEADCANILRGPLRPRAGEGRPE